MFLKAREMVLASGPRDWIVWGVGALLFLVLLWLFGMLGTWIAFSVLAIGSALGIHYGLDRRIEKEREPAIAAAEKLFKTMPLQGLDEASLRQFVCKYSGAHWEEYFEALFGYEAKLEAREWSRGEMGKTREKFAAWREPIIAWIDARQAARKAAAERKHLQAVEAKALQAEGMNAAEAAAKADQMAEAMVEQAAVVKAAAAKPAVKPPPTAATLPVAATAAPIGGETTALEAPVPAPAPANLKQMLETARKPEKLFTLKPKKKAGPGAVGSLLGELVGPRMRFLVGAALLAGFLLWLYQNDLLSVDKIIKQLQAMLPTALNGPKPTTAMWLPLVPLEITQIFGTVHAGIAGFILIASGIFSSRRMTVAVVPGAAAVFVAPRVGGWLGLPSLGAVGCFAGFADSGLGTGCAGFRLAA